MPDTTVYGDDSRTVKSFFLWPDPWVGAKNNVLTARQLARETAASRQGYRDFSPIPTRKVSADLSRDALGLIGLNTRKVRLNRATCSA